MELYMAHTIFGQAIYSGRLYIVFICKNLSAGLRSIYFTIVVALA